MVKFYKAQNQLKLNIAKHIYISCKTVLITSKIKNNVYFFCAKEMGLNSWGAHK